jgi:hypothetical protein
MPSDTRKPSSPATIALTWLIVLVPAAWGLYLTAMRAANLFK